MRAYCNYSYMCSQDVTARPISEEDEFEVKYYCYYHQKIVDGLIGNSSDYTVIED